MIKLELDLLNLSAGDLQYAANMIAKVAADKQAIADNAAQKQAQEILARSANGAAKPEVPQPQTESVQ